MRLRSFRSRRPAVRFYYPSRTIINRHQLVASPFINTISPCSSLQHIPFLHHHLALHLATLLPSPGPVTSFTPSSPANRRHRVALFVLGKGAPHSSLYF